MPAAGENISSANPSGYTQDFRLYNRVFRLYAPDRAACRPLTISADKPAISAEGFAIPAEARGEMHARLSEDNYIPCFAGFGFIGCDRYSIPAIFMVPARGVNRITTLPFPGNMAN
jgi:hypothetical protein